MITRITGGYECWHLAKQSADQPLVIGYVSPCPPTRESLQFTEIGGGTAGAEELTTGRPGALRVTQMAASLAVREPVRDHICVRTLERPADSSAGAAAASQGHRSIAASASTEGMAPATAELGAARSSPGGWLAEPDPARLSLSRPSHHIPPWARARRGGRLRGSRRGDRAGRPGLAESR